MNRDQLRDMFGGKCAYCGRTLGARFHVDHIKPLLRGCSGASAEGRGDDTLANTVPSCPRCNLRKSILSVEDFREEIAAQTQRLLRDSAAFRLAVDFGIVQITRAPVVFWCERYRNLEDDPRYLLEHDVL